MKLFYWAGYFGNVDMVDNFLVLLGVSPFMKMFNGANVASACVQGQQFELLEYLVKDTHWGKKRLDRPRHKYQVQLYDSIDYFYKSRRGKDN